MSPSSTLTIGPFMHPLACKSFVILALLLCTSLARGDDYFPAAVQPMLRQFCLECHSKEQKKGDVNLEQIISRDSAASQPKLCEQILEQLANGEMPPKGKPQLSAEQKSRLIAWLHARLDQAALASAGDPGAVVLRRLSNAEYTYTLRDLTGVESLNPAKEFPVDGAAGEGFTNVGGALVMSPTLLTKYFDAAKEVADHVVLVPDGIRFSAGTSPRDWTDETLTKIRSFYGSYSGADGHTPVNLQGIQFDTNSGGRLPLEKYIKAFLDERDVLLGDKKTIADVARERGLNEKYLSLLWDMMRYANLHDKRSTESQSSILLDSIRAKWSAGTLVVADIAAWQKALWRFTTVGRIGMAHGPKSWQEPTTPLASSIELRLHLKAPADGSDIVFYLAAGDAGDGNSDDYVCWENPRLLCKGQPDRPLSEAEVKLRPPIRFGNHFLGNFISPKNIWVHAPSLVEVRLPANQVAALPNGAEFVVAGKLDRIGGKEGSVQLQVLSAKPQDDLRALQCAPVIVNDGSDARNRFESAFDDFRQLFPSALCYSQIVPVDEPVTLKLFYREDDQLRRLMLDDAQSKALDSMWDELLFVSEAPLKQVDSFDQVYQFATQDADPSVLEPLRNSIVQGAAAFRKRAVELEPKQVQAVIDFAARAWRRPLSSREQAELQSLYGKLRNQGLPHSAAVRMLVARVLVAPAFLYRSEQAPPGSQSMPINDRELATRLSYFLWSSSPDDELRAAATAGSLHTSDVLIAQAHRMLKDGNIRRLAMEFGCQWLQVRDFATLDEKSERHFPAFKSLRADMQEEVVQFFIDLFQSDRSILTLLDADYSFANGPLARFYGIDVKSEDWQRVEGLRALGRGGILGFASTLAKQSGAARSSPILRGDWINEVVLGDKLPRPPKGVPVLPEEAPQGFTDRQLVERHSSDAACARCHQRIDPFGFALEGFDAIGHARKRDAAHLATNTAAKLPDGTQVDGLSGLRSYIVEKRKDAFLMQFCRKLLGFALGRSVQLSDKPLLEAILTELKANDFKVCKAIELIVQSRQFREVRGRDLVGSPRESGSPRE